MTIPCNFFLYKDHTDITCWGGHLSLRTTAAVGHALLLAFLIPERLFRYCRIRLIIRIPVAQRR